MRKNKKGYVQQLLPALSIPIVLLIFVSIFNGMSISADNQWEVDYVNESMTFTLNTSTSLANTPIDSITSIDNQTGTMSTYSYNADTGIITQTGTDGAGGSYNVSYAGHGGDGWDAFEDIESGTWSGYALGSQLPFIIIAIMVLGILIGAFVYTRMG